MSEEMTLVVRAIESSLDSVSEITLSKEPNDDFSDDSKVETEISDEITVGVVTGLKLDELE